MSTVAEQKAQAVDMATRGSLDRTTADILAGKSNVPTRQLNPEQKLMLERARVRDQYFKGLITVDTALSRLGVSKKLWEVEQAERTTREGAKAARALKSETAKQDTQRELAARQGVAVGTINKDGSGSISNQSRIAKNVKVSNFVESQKQSVSQRIGSTTNPIKSQQPDQTLVSPYLTNNMDKNRIELIPLQGAVQQKKVFLPGGNLDYIYGTQQKISRKETSDNFLEAFGSNLYNALRYSDRVDAGEVEPPKGVEFLPYYASVGLRPLYNIPLSLMGDKTIQPTLGSTVIDIPIDLVTKGKTKTHDPIGDYVRRDPLATLVQLPSEAALWVYGAKGAEVASKVFKTYSPLLYQTKKIPGVVGEKPTTIYRGITFKDRPLIGIQQGKITKGFDESKVAESLSKVKAESLGREGIEAGLGSGVESELIYSRKTLSELVSRGIIPEIGKQRALQAKIITKQGVKITSQVGSFGNAPIEGLTSVQAKALLSKVVKGQEVGDIDLVHGSTALRPQLGDDIIKESGSSTKLGDVDVHPTGLTLKIKAAKADNLIRGFAADFPLSTGQRLSIKGLGSGESTNRALELSGGTLKEPKKIFEVVLKSTDESAYGIPQGTKVLGERIPFKKSVTAKDYPIKLHTADYQLLTNIKQVTAFQKGTGTLLDVYPSSGRTKDIVRAYWNVKAKALFKGGEQGKLLDIEAEKFRKLYPGIEFTDYAPEKVLLSSRPVYSTASSKTGSPTLQLLKFSSPKESIRDSKIESLKTQSDIQSLVGSKTIRRNLSVKPLSIKDSSSIPTPRSLVPLSRTGKPISTSRLTGSGRQSVKPPSVKPNNTLSVKGIPSVKTPLTTISTKPLPRPITGRPITIRPITLTQTNKRLLNIQQRPKGAIIGIITRDKTKKTKGTKKVSHDFLGSTRVAEITGFRTIKSDITVGDKKTKRLYEEDILKTKRKYKKSDKKNTINLLGKKSKTSLL